ncbi:protein translocase subunit SecF [Candidatus Dependentiae bacterium]|nr:protein translocase subunit SecF [Candidatus Dependentiae bacterium]
MVNFMKARHAGGEIRTLDFLKYRYVSAVISLLILVSFFAVYAYKKYTTIDGHTFNYSVDFTGGIQASFVFNKPVTGEQIVSILEKKGWAGSVTREFSAEEHLVRVKKESKDVAQEAEAIRNALKEGLGEGYTVSIQQTDSVGSASGATWRAKSLAAIFIALFLMLLYIALRFWSFAYAMGAIVSLFHDAIIVLLLFLIFDKEISMNVIGAILATLGYSINDTIVIFSRIRENVALMPTKSMYDIINISITETLSRTLLTTFATTLVVIALFVFGGETLRDLSLALLVGIVFGIYSTIFIATPVLYMLYNKKSA